VGKSGGAAARHVRPGLRSPAAAGAIKGLLSGDARRRTRRTACYSVIQFRSEHRYSKGKLIHLIRRLLNLLTALSLLLCVAACVLWVRSYFGHEAVGWFYRHTHAVRHGGYREEKRVVERFRGAESGTGAVGVGAVPGRLGAG